MPFQENIGLYTDDTTLKDIWILELQKKIYSSDSININSNELELVKDLEYDHELTKEKILCAMSAYGISRWSVATIIKEYELDMT